MSPTSETTGAATQAASHASSDAANPDVVQRLRTDTWALATPEGRMPGTAGHDAARALIEGRFDDLGLIGHPRLDGYRHEFRAWDGIVMSNLVGVVPGADHALPPIVLGAHYDSVLEAPCADDNAAAVAMLLEVAARLTVEPLSRDVLVVAFDAEEPPYFLGPDMGSNRLVSEVLTAPVHLAVVMDLVGHAVSIPGLPLDPDLIFVTGAESHPALPALLDGLDLPIVAAAQSRVGDYSDYAAFRLAGAPYLFFSGGEWPHYHRASDHPDLMDYPRMAKLAGDVEQVLRRADAVATDYHATTPQTDFEVATMERAFGPELLAATASRLGRSGYRSPADLDAIIGGLRSLLQ